MKKILPLLYTTGIDVMVSCSISTQITSNWREPSKHISIANLNKVLVVVMSMIWFNY